MHRAVANQVGFTGSYKAYPDECLRSATEFLLKQGIKLDFDSGVRRFCEAYRTSANDPDGADAFLCLVTAITCLERMAEICGGQASRSVLTEEGVIVVPTPCMMSGRCLAFETSKRKLTRKGKGVIYRQRHRQSLGGNRRRRKPSDARNEDYRQNA